MKRHNLVVSPECWHGMCSACYCTQSCDCSCHWPDWGEPELPEIDEDDFETTEGQS